MVDLTTKNSFRRVLPPILIALGTAYVSIWVFGVGNLSVNPIFAVFFPIGIGGASIANATGMGGGVVFIPAFSVIDAATPLSLSTPQIVAMSFLIQCFGMTVGSLTWISQRIGAGPQTDDLSLTAFFRIVGLCLAGCLPGLWLMQVLLTQTSPNLLLLFKSFSILLGSLLFVSVLVGNNDRAPRTTLHKIDARALPVLGFFGGAATALFSVGVGEFLALGLFLRGYSLNTSVGSAVIVSALTVIAGAPFSILTQTIIWEIVALAVPGVVIGGWLGRRIAQGLGATRLKLVASVWIVGSSLYLIAAAIR